mmetsp:Transcript_22339/g.73430  ORF Transcript_22339/g.73430 Transcript_22339/m.73430 type:complete len:256 (+) Transcript_22339:97-864(+)
MSSETEPMLGSSGSRKVERPQNWKDATNSGWQAPVYESETVRKQVQKDFLIKVYSILCAQLLVTTLICALFVFAEPVTYFVLGNIWLTLLLFIVNLFVIIALWFLKNTYPWNYILLGVFTLSMGFMVGVTCAAYTVNGMGYNIAFAALLTLVIFVSLTVFVSVSDIDFSFLGLFLPVCLIVLLVWSLFAIIFGFQLGMLFGAIGALLFSGFIIYDTWMIMNKMGCDDYIIASIELYLDVINLFSMLLLVMGGGDS